MQIKSRNHIMYALPNELFSDKIDLKIAPNIL